VANWVFARPDHQRGQIASNFACRALGSLLGVVLNFKFRQNQLSDFGVVGGKIHPFLLFLAMNFITACTTVQAVMCIGNRARALNCTIFSDLERPLPHRRFQGRHASIFDAEYLTNGTRYMQLVAVEY